MSGRPFSTGAAPMLKNQTQSLEEKRDILSILSIFTPFSLMSSRVLIPFSNQAGLSIRTQTLIIATAQCLTDVHEFRRDTRQQPKDPKVGCSRPRFLRLSDGAATVKVGHRRRPRRRGLRAMSIPALSGGSGDKIPDGIVAERAGSCRKFNKIQNFREDTAVIADQF